MANRAGSGFSKRTPATSPALGTCSSGQIMPRVLCANNHVYAQCLNPATMTCGKCYLVKYCGSGCQAQHWKTHKNDCKHPYNNSSWQPAWAAERRSPVFFTQTNNGPAHTFFGTFRNYIWGNVPAINCLQLSRNEGNDAVSMDLKFCFAASGDLRNLIMTVNDLPDNYQGKCDILCNDLNGIVVNRNLVILFVLLEAGTDVAEAAELAVHLMYSAALTPAMANYVAQCTEKIYGTHGTESAVWDTRGIGKLRSLQWISDIQPALRMFRSKYHLVDALTSMRSIMWSPERVDYRDRYLSSLQPGHRLAFSRFRTTGILLPFGVDICHFTEPNRLLFSPDGRWLSMDDANPLFGWDLGPVFDCGQRNGATRADSYGCLFFYLKEQFQKFATRAEKFKLNITLSQADARVLGQSIPAGLVQNFRDARFDRIETSNLADYLGAGQIIKSWGTLLNKTNPHSVLLMNFMNWMLQQPDSRVRDDARKLNKKLLDQAAAVLVRECSSTKRDVYLINPIPSNDQSLECAEAFYDNEHQFSDFVRKSGALQAAAAAGVRLRAIHRIHPKRSGLMLDNTNQTIPNLTKTQFNDLFLLGGANYTDRFVEIE
ncbi:hypothetical protein C8F04DRAFT_1337414, partial [Mycena alexandri]